MINVYEFLRYQPELYKQLNCKGLLFAYYYCPQTIRNVDVFTHYNILSFVMEGRKLIHRPEKTWLLEEGHCYFFKTGAFNQELYLEEGWRSMNLYIPDNYLHQFIQENQSVLQRIESSELPLGQISELEASVTTQRFVQQMLACFDETIAPAEDILEGRFRELLLAILGEPENQSLVAYMGKLAKRTRPLLYAVMETNFMYNLSLTEFAQLAHQSLATFKREFKRVFNTTPAQWLMEKSIRDIVQESGFESGPHISRVFKHQFGESPLHYRKQLIHSS
jgi:AraC-like DNA-binding protein